MLLREDKLKSAEVTLKKAVAVSPQDAFCMSTLGIVYYKHASLRRRDHLPDASHPDRTEKCGGAQLPGHHFQPERVAGRGVGGIDESHRLNPKYADAHFNLAVVYATYSPPALDRAQEHYKIAISLGAAPDPRWRN